MDNAIVLEKLQGGFQVKRFVWPDAVIDVFPMEELLVEFWDYPRAIIDFVELLGMGSIGAFHLPI